MGTAGTVLPLLCAMICVWAGVAFQQLEEALLLEALFFARCDPLDSPIIYVHDCTWYVLASTSHSGKGVAEPAARLQLSVSVYKSQQKKNVLQHYQYFQTKQ